MKNEKTDFDDQIMFKLPVICTRNKVNEASMYLRLDDEWLTPMASLTEEQCKIFKQEISEALNGRYY